MPHYATRAMPLRLTRRSDLAPLPSRLASHARLILRLSHIKRPSHNKRPSHILRLSLITSVPLILRLLLMVCNMLVMRASYTL